MSFIKSLFRIKAIKNNADHSTGLLRCLTALDLTMLGIGAIIGAGIFVLTGIAAATQAGPGIIVSFLLASIVGGFCALAYAELAASIGGCGSAYGYAFASLGELIAWIIGWDLLLEYGMDVATVSIGWSGYFVNALHAFGISLPKMLTTDYSNGGLINLPAISIIFSLAYILTIGVQQSTRFNNIVVFIKLLVVGLFIAVGALYFDSKNWHPFLPFGTQGIINGAGFIFFAYIGFDAVSTAAEETIRPQRDLPIGIIASLIICTLVYMVVAGVLTGIASYPTLNNTSPVAVTLFKLGNHVVGEIIALGAIAGLTTTILVFFYGLTRISLAMARDGLLPRFFGKIDQKSRTPRQLIWCVAMIMATIAGFFPIEQIANLVNIGTLAAFAVVCMIVIVLHYTKPDMPRPFKMPLSPIVPGIGFVLCFYLMFSLPLITWVSFLVWTLMGLAIYFAYSRNNSIVKVGNVILAGEN